MAKIVPFCAIRPTRDKVSLVASRSYLSYSKKTLHEKLCNNPYTFLHIINPDYSKGVEVKDYPLKFKMVKEKFKNFLDKNILEKDKKKHFYIYQKVNSNNNTFIGIIGAASVKDYLNGEIKIHEQTIEKREQLFKNYLDTTEFNAEAVLLTYPKHASIDSIINKYALKRAEYEFTTTNKSTHRLWLVNNDNDIKIISDSFSEIDFLYIADGHHRFASSSLLYKDKKQTKVSKKDFCMSYLISEDQLKIINFNRLIKSLNGLSVDEFINHISKKYTIEKKKKAFQPNLKDEIALYIEKQWYSLIAKEEFVNRNHCVDKLDPAILSKNILSPILNIKDPRNDKRLAFFDGTFSINTIQDKIDSGDFKAAFILKSINIEQLKEVADKGESMPPKSTYIQPKIRSGMLIYDLSN